MAAADRRSSDAYAVARRLHQVTEVSRQSFEATVAKLGLTAAQARVVLRLFEPTSMSDLADHLGCDASNVTGIAARLIARELATSTPGPDRRVKFLELTALGRRLRSDLERQINRSSPAMAKLNSAERRSLILLLDKLVGAAGGR